MVTHVNPGGAAESRAGAMLVNSLCASSPVNFIRRLEVAAQKLMHELQAESAAVAGGAAVSNRNRDGGDADDQSTPGGGVTGGGEGGGPSVSSPASLPRSVSPPPPPLPKPPREEGSQRRARLIVEEFRESCGRGAAMSPEEPLTLAGASTAQADVIGRNGGDPGLE